MPLKISTFPVNEITLGSKTEWNNDGRLELDREDLLSMIQNESFVYEARLDIAIPDRSVRIINYHDIYEPRIKAEGPGVTYPGKCGRSVETVGEGHTHRLEGISVIGCLDGDLSPYVTTDSAEPPTPERGKLSGWINSRFIDMSGPSAVLSYASLQNLCLTLSLNGELDSNDRALVINSAVIKLCDKLAETTIGSNPPYTETFDLEIRDSSLPGVVLICLLSSSENRNGPRSSAGNAIYGSTRLSAPWILNPTEFMDGAVTGGSEHETWPFTNNPLVLDLCRRHGKSLNFLGCIVGRTNWGGEDEMRLSGNRAAHAAKLLGAQGAIITNNIRGRRFVDSIRTIQACEHVGIRTVFVSEEEDNENGEAPAFLFHPTEMGAVVSTGTGAVGPFPAVDEVIGTLGRAHPDWYQRLPAIPGRYGAGHVRDLYGIGKQSYTDY